MAGGILAGVIGPQLATLTADAWPPHTFAVTYLASASVALIAGVILQRVRFRPVPTAERTQGRPLGQILRQPRLQVAMLCGAVSYMLMNFMMTSAPLAMNLCGIPGSASNTGLQWHIMAMYAPSFFTGGLIARFGPAKMVFAGLTLITAAAGVGLSGQDIAHFWTALILLGVGWNFGFLGASAMVLECHSSSERTTVQSANDLVVFGSMVVGSFLSGDLLTSYGWEMVCLVMLPLLAIAIVVVVVAPQPKKVSMRAGS